MQVRALVAFTLLFAAAPAYADEVPSEASSDWAFGAPQQLDVGAWFGLGSRLDDPPRWEVDRRHGLLAGLGLDLFLSRRMSLGLGYEHLELGAEQSGITPTGTVRVSRRLDTLWLGARVYPIQTEEAGAFLRLGVGLAWQHASLNGSAWPVENPGAAVPLSCRGTGSPNVALGAAVGADAHMGAGLRFLGSLGIDALRLSDEVIGGCAPGAGSGVVLGVRLGFAYGIGL